MRAFIVGNGLSLKRTNLDKLQGEISFAVNNIHLVYPTTQWRPTHYVRAEGAQDLDPETWIDSMLIQVQGNAEIFCNVWFPKWMERNHLPLREMNIIDACAHYTAQFDTENCPHMWHLPRICTFGSTVSVAMQIAVLLGYGPLYLIGCDLGYKDNQPSHFDEHYEHGREQPARLANINAFLGHVIAKRSSPVPIYNATLGGDLEVYERVDYESLFDEKNLSTGKRREFETNTAGFAYRTG